MPRPAVAVAKDDKTGDDVRVSGSYYSINGSEPMLIPADLRGQDEMAIARELLRRFCGKVDDGSTKKTAG